MSETGGLRVRTRKCNLYHRAISILRLCLELELLEGGCMVLSQDSWTSKHINGKFSFTLSPRLATSFYTTKNLFSNESERRFGRVQMSLHLEKLASVLFLFLTQFPKIMQPF